MPDYIYPFMDGASKFLIAFGLACLFIVIFNWLLQLSTPYNERELIAQGNKAAAIALSGSILGFALPVASALTQTVSVLEFVMWTILAGIIQILASLIVRRIVIVDLVERIKNGNIATALYLAATSLAIGMLNAASMTY
jgi:putative membrane protein